MPEDTAPAATLSNVVTLADGGPVPPTRRLPGFIRDNVGLIVGEWEDFARTMTPFSGGMSPLALRDHIHQILDFVVSDIEKVQSAEAQQVKSYGSKDATNTAAQTHAALRFAGGFDIGQMASEYRALRASVLRLWSTAHPVLDARDLYEMTRFNEAIDQELAESVNFYKKKVLQSERLLIGIVGHELRSPVQAIRLSAELALHMAGMNERQTVLFKNVLESADRMGALIKTLIDVTQARYGAGLPVVRSMMDMGFVARQIVDEVRAQYPRRAIEISMSGKLSGEWDKARIGQVFSNLLNNAIQYGFQDAPIRVEVEGGPQTITLALSNEGVPIAPERIEAIFDPLTRGLPDENSLGQSANLGLGLYITKQVVLAHGGTIGVVSSETGGTTFTAVIPRSGSAPMLQDAERRA